VTTSGVQQSSEVVHRLQSTVVGVKRNWTVDAELTKQPHRERRTCGGNWTTRGYANSRIANSRTGHLADWSTRRLDNSRTSQLADWTRRGLDNSRSRRCRQTGKLSAQSRRWHPRVVQSASRPVRELAIRELAYPRVVQ